MTEFEFGTRLARRTILVLILSAAAVLSACGDSDAEKPVEGHNARASGENDSAGQAGQVIGPITTETEDPLPVRASKRWSLIIGGNLELAYDFLSPAYRANQERKDYVNQMRGRPVTWVSADFVDQKCTSETECSASVRIEYKLTMPGSEAVESVNMATEQWVKAEGQWYFSP
jgi:hypothetical protein